jgi:hypothetical protein
MKITEFLLLQAIFAFSACTEKDANAVISGGINSSYADVTDTVKIPINDLGTGTYRGFTGGLYPGGANSPSKQYKNDLKNFALSIVPLDSNGIHSFKGKIGFISLGGSTCGRNMTSLREKTLANPLTNPLLVLVNCSNGGGSSSLNSIMDPNDIYWTHVNSQLKAYHINDKQVQVIYLESDDSSVSHSFPGRIYLVRDDIEEIMRVCKTKFKQLKFIYVLGRTTTFHLTARQNQEPCPYFNGWADKFAIEDQINGLAGTAYKGDSAVAPMITWGFYQWADGSAIPRQDGFTWQESDTEDGLHGTDAGQDTLSTRFQNFLLKDKYASLWYGNHTKPAIAP